MLQQRDCETLASSLMLESLRGHDT